MSHHANEVFYENLREKILDTNVIDLVWEIHDQGTTSSDGRLDAETLEAIAFSNEDLFIDQFDGFVSFPRITTGEFLDFLEEMAGMTNLDKDTVYGLKIDVEEVYEILNRVLDVRAEEGWLV